MNYPAWQLKKGDPAAETSLAGAGCGVLLRRVHRIWLQNNLVHLL